MAEKLCLTMGKGGEGKVYIYNRGAEYFGGLRVGYNSGATPTRTKYPDYYYIHGQASSSQGSNGSTITTNLIDLTNFSKVGFTLKSVALTTSSAFGIFIGANPSGTAARARYMRTGGSNASDSINGAKLEIDVSDMTGSYYVGVVGTSSSGSSERWTAEITEIYLIP